MFGMRRLAAWAVLVFAVAYLLREPVEAAGTAATVFDGFTKAADSLSAFVAALS